MSVSIVDKETLSKIRSKAWTVADDVEPWELADAARALCEKP
ncbi:hypothetical protein [Sediminihaliea albiluteola]|nr:hypothetical protein [Sediminihaliea albiluteola]